MFIFKCIAIGLSMLTTAQMTASTNNSEQEKTLIPRNLLFGNPVKSYPRLSPDGTRLGYLAPDDKNVLNVWIKDLDHPETPDAMVTKDKKRGIRNFVWQFDNQNILYVQDKDGDENWHLYQTHLATGKTIDLTPFSDIQAGIIDYNHLYPDEILVKMNHRSKSLFDAYRINLKTAACVLEVENFDKNESWVADNHSQIRATSSLSETGDTIIRIRDNTNSPWREFLRLDCEESAEQIVGFSPDENELYMFASQENDTSRLLKFNIATGERSVIKEDPQYDVGVVMSNPNTFEIEAVGVVRERLEWTLLDQSLSVDFKKLQELAGANKFHVISRDQADQNWVVAVTSDRHSNKYYIYHRATGAIEFLFSAQPKLDEYELSPMKPISFKARDGMKIYGYLTLPVDKKPNNLPTILFVHGGPWTRDNWSCNSSVQWFANRGYAVLQINYRGSQGYGKKYLNAGNREWSGKMHTDLIDGKNWMIKEGYADPEKVAIYGGSYGGYSTLVGLTFTPDDFCCGVDVVGPSNLVTLIKTFPAYWSTWTAQLNRRVGNVETDVEFLNSCSPLFKVDRIKKPLLIAQGANDPRVKQAESDQIVEAMRKNNLPVEYLLFPDEGHGFVRPENRMMFSAAAEQFLAKYLGGRCQPPLPEENCDFVRK